MNPLAAPTPDWNLIRSFVAVVEAGSLAAAARELRLAHPTVARHVQQLEGTLGLALFDRRSSGLVLNAAGRRLAAAARGMHDHARAFAEVIASVRSSTSGRVRITAADPLAAVLPVLLAPLCRAGSDGLIQIDLLIGYDQLNLLEHEADIAVRHAAPRQQDLVARRLADLPYGLYASTGYLAVHGEPCIVGLRNHRVIDGVIRPHFARQAARLGMRLDSAQFVLRTDAFAAQLQAAAAGWGIAGLPRHVAEATPGLVQVLHEVPFRGIGMWIVGRPEVRRIAYLDEAFSLLADRLNGFVAEVETRGLPQDAARNAP
jgi:DNA-binding transcriptional LysR family regulator